MSAPLDVLLDDLAKEMAQTNAAIVQFDGSGCLVHAQNEVTICGAIERTAGHGLVNGFRVPARLIELLRRRKALLSSTQRTVRALLGVCAAQSCTYSAPY